MNNSDLIYGTGKYERKPMDFYPTPPDVTHALLDHLERHLLIGAGCSVWEPACGDGDMAEVMIKRGYVVKSTDLRRTGYAVSHNGGGLDYTNAPSLQTDWIITNPPFNVAEAFIRRSLAERVPFALLLKSQYWHSQRRNGLFYERKPMFICPLSWRPQFEGKGKSSLMDFIWTIWGATDGDARYLPLKKGGDVNHGI